MTRGAYFRVLDCSRVLMVPSHLFGRKAQVHEVAETATVAILVSYMEGSIASSVEQGMTHEGMTLKARLHLSML